MYEAKSSANQNRSDDDLSPVRKKKSPDGYADKRKPHFQPKIVGGEDSGSSKIAKKTLDGKTSGLQSAKMLRDEAELLRKKENEMFEKISTEMSGRGAEAIVRNKFGRVRNSEERRREEEKKERENERKRTYTRWGKGLKQIEELQTKALDDMHEMSKPLARYSDDADLDSMLKSRERVGDPMLDYIRKKSDKSQTEIVPSVPVYKGSYPENRFNIRPGYRWDGVDRSNGYEQKWFDVQNQKKALQEEAYKYSTEDM